MKSWLRVFLLFTLGSFIFSCALQVSPTGGEKDTKAPKVTKTIPENFSTGFTGKQVILNFDEYVQVKDIATQLVVSPPLQNPVKTQLRKKSLRLIFDDTLIANTTYTLNFGNSITDLDEGNLLDTFQFVFSTGDHLDSMFISGTVENAFDKKPVENALVMLYRENDDSLPFKKVPLYFGKSNKAGVYKIRNISEGKYKVFGLKETAPDYKYNSPDEDIAFSDSMIDAGRENLKLEMFREATAAQFLKVYSEEAGKAIAVFSQRMDSVHYEWLNDTVAMKLFASIWSAGRDSLTFWYKNLQTDSLQMVFINGSKRDTTSTRLFKFDGKQNLKHKFALNAFTEPADAGRQDLNKDLVLKFNHPIAQLLPDSIHFNEDSVPVIRRSFHFADSLHRELHIICNWKEDKKYSLFLPPGTCTDIFGLKNDSLQLSFTTHEKNDYGSLTVHVENSKLKFPVLLQVIDDKETVYRAVGIQKDSVLVFEYLLPLTYRLKLTEDRNGNQKWDTGNYLRHSFPEETLYYPEMVTVRANWDVDVKWKTK